MPKTKNKPGIHLHQTALTIMDVARGIKPLFWWVIIAKNGNIIGRSWRSYTRKSGAVNSIKIVAKLFEPLVSKELGAFRVYYDHSKKEDVIL